MQKYCIIFLLLIANGITAQDRYPRVEKYEVIDKIIDASIDTIPITIYLKYHSGCNYGLTAYSVKGWYYYDKYKINIPLVGIVSNGKITLYQFDNKDKEQHILDFEYEDNGPSDEIEHYEGLKDFKEKLILTEEGGNWTDGEKNIEIYHFAELDILDHNEFLCLSDDYCFDLTKLRKKNFDLVAHKNGRIILNYENRASIYYPGRCGMAFDTGFYYLRFDKNQNLIKAEHFILSDCFRVITYEKNKISKGVSTYNSLNNDGSQKNPSYKVNLNEVWIKTIN